VSCGGKIIQRIDDTEAGVKKRLEVYQKETMLVVEYYKKQGFLVEINGDQTIEKVFDEVLNKLKELKISE
jgi:adenylate kinase